MRITFEIEISNAGDVPSATCGIAISNTRGQRVAFFHTLYHSGFRFQGTDKSRDWFAPSHPLPLEPASYHVELVLADVPKVIDRVERADRLDVVFADLLGSGKIPNSSQGIMVMPAEWEVEGAEITERIVRREVGGMPDSTVLIPDVTIGGRAGWCAVWGGRVCRCVRGPVGGRGGVGNDEC